MRNRDVEPLSESEIFELLENARRRHVIRYMQENDGAATLDEVVDYVAATENDVRPEDLTTAQRRRVHVSLTQAHLPKMDAAGVVDYHDDRKVVERSAAATSVETYLAEESRTIRPWLVYYAVLSLAAIGCVVLYRMDAPLIGDLSPLAISGAFVAVLLGISIMHLVSVLDVI